MKSKKVPLRKCVGCQQMKHKKELLRIASNKEGVVFPDPSGKAHGRGAYVCRDSGCLDLAIKNKSLNRSFQKKIPDDVYDTLKELFQKEIVT